MLVVALLCAMITVPAQAAGSGSLSMSSASGSRGDTVTLSVSLDSNPGLVTMTIRVSYDTDVLQLTNVSNPGLLVGAQLNPTYGSPYTISWVDGATTTNNTATGTIATFTFKILDDAKIGDSTVSLQFIDSYDAEYGENSFSAYSGTVSVVCKNHDYGSWTKLDDTYHGQTCSICQNVQKEKHNWDNGTTIKEASCKEGGQVKYTCTTCSATKTENTPKTDDHSYGAWTKVDDNTHKHICTICSKEETAGHTWNSGTVTQQPTCKNEGVKTYTCTACNGTKTEPVAKTDDHSYGAWTKVDDNTHKHVCTVCSKEETAGHTWNSGAVTQQPTCKDEGVKTYTCTVCNGTKTEPVAKTEDHSYGAWTQVDDNTHKHVCTICSKEETDDHTWNDGEKAYMVDEENKKITALKTEEMVGIVLKDSFAQLVPGYSTSFFSKLAFAGDISNKIYTEKIDDVKYKVIEVSDENSTKRMWVSSKMNHLVKAEVEFPNGDIFYYDYNISFGDTYKASVQLPDITEYTLVTGELEIEAKNFLTE